MLSVCVGYIFWLSTKGEERLPDWKCIQTMAWWSLNITNPPLTDVPLDRTWLTNCIFFNMGISTCLGVEALHKLMFMPLWWVIHLCNYCLPQTKGASVSSQQTVLFLEVQLQSQSHISWIFSGLVYLGIYYLWASMWVWLWLLDKVIWYCTCPLCPISLQCRHTYTHAHSQAHRH